MLMPSPGTGSKEELINSHGHTLLKKRGAPSLLLQQIHIPLFVMRCGVELKCTGVNKK